MGLREVQVAALLHDIGKFYQRAGKAYNQKYKDLSENDYGRTGAHSKWSASYISGLGLGKTIEDIVLFHHNPEKARNKFLAKIVQKADHDSAKERTKTETKREVRKEPIISIFSKVKISEMNHPVEYYLPLVPLTSDLLKPQPTKKGVMEGWHLQQEYENLWSKFETESALFKGNINFNTLFFLIKKYTTLMPSAAFVDESDISLFDHSKSTAALATCLYQYSGGKEMEFSDAERYYLIVSGDIAGIQKFIYKISSPQEAQKGMSKRLRGRSFYINLINDAITTLIVEKLNLTYANILFSGGGHFVIIAHNTDITKKEIEEISDKVNKDFLRRYNGELYLTVSSEACSSQELKNFGKIIGEGIGFENLKKKKQKFVSMINEVFEDEREAPLFLCPVCGNEKEEEKKVCSQCEKHENIGNKVVNAEYMIKALSEQADLFQVHEFGVGYKFFKTSDAEKLIRYIKDLSDKVNYIEVLRINNTEFVDGSLVEFSNKSKNVSFGFSFIGNVAPFHRKKGVLYFDHLAKISKGSNKLGILKMDIDNLGKIFSKGLGDNATISRVSTLSSFLDLFFLGYINEIAKDYYILENVCEDCQDKVKPIRITFKEDEKEEQIMLYKEKTGKKVCEDCLKTKIPSIYIIYSGGDDLLVVGPYDDIINFSKSLRMKFKEWCCNNSDITLSGGIAITGPKFPIGRATSSANSLLDISKDKDKNLKLSMSNQDTGKDRITLFNETVRWDSSDDVPGFNDLFNFAIELENLIDNNKVSKGLIYSLLAMWHDTFKDEGMLSDKVRKEKKKYVPLLKYKLARTVKDKKLMEDLNRKLVINPGYMRWIKIPVSWVSLRMR